LLAGDRFSELWREVSDDAAEKVSGAADKAKTKLDAARDEATP
jgi:hypothetical protein